MFLSNASACYSAFSVGAGRGGNEPPPLSAQICTQTFAIFVCLCHVLDRFFGGLLKATLRRSCWCFFLNNAELRSLKSKQREQSRHVNVMSIVTNTSNVNRTGHVDQQHFRQDALLYCLDLDFYFMSSRWRNSLNLLN